MSCNVEAECLVLQEAVERAYPGQSSNPDIWGAHGSNGKETAQTGDAQHESEKARQRKVKHFMHLVAEFGRIDLSSGLIAG